MISVAYKKKSSNINANLILTNAKTSSAIQTKDETNSLPHTPSEQKKMKTSNDINDTLNLEIKSKNVSSSPTNNNLEKKPSKILKQPLTTNLQKYYSFQKNSFSLSENKCSCFNMQFVCEICTTRYLSRNKDLRQLKRLT